MFDIGWMELMVIGIVALIVVGPKDLPGLFRAAGQFMGKARGMAREFQRSMEAAADETGLGEAGRQLSTLNRKLNLDAATGSARRYAERATAGTAAAKAGARPPEPARDARAGRRRRGGEGRLRAAGAMKDDELDDTSAPLIEHLAELRTRLINALVAFVRGDDRRLRRRRPDLQLPRRAARRAPGRARPEARADLHRAAAGLHDPGAHLGLRRLHPRLPGYRLPALALRRARPLPPGEARLPAVPARLADPLRHRRRLRLLRGAAARLRLLPRASSSSATRRRRRGEAEDGARSSISAPSTSISR